jgi:hypothetical protein
MKKLTILVFTLTFLVTLPISGGIIFSDSFDAECTQGLNFTGFDQWTVTDGTVDLLGPGLFADLCTPQSTAVNQNRCVDLDGSTGNPGVLTSLPVSLLPGLVQIRFDLGGSQRGDTNTVMVTFGGFVNQIYVLASSDPLATRTIDVAVNSATSASLAFSNDGSNNIGLILDNVVIDQVSTVSDIPEPGTSALLGAGLIGLAALARRRRLA